MDLDDDELKATREMNRTKNNKTMLSDEEKNAIEWLKSKINEYVIKSELDENIEIILNLIENLIFKTETQKELLKYKTDKIEKQQKEIEELKEKNNSQLDCEEPIERIEEMVNMKWVNHNYISKDKIKAKIEEIDKILERNLLVDRLRDYFDVQKEVLHSLLEEE